MTVTIYHEQDGDITPLKDKTIAVIGFGNQAKAQALNMRDSGLQVIIGAKREEYKKRAQNDGFETYSISESVQKGDFIFLLVSDEVMKNVFNNSIKPHLNPQKTLVVSTGYYFVYNILDYSNEVDILLISPKGLGEMIRKQFLNEEGFFSFVSVYQDQSGNAQKNLLGLTKALGGLSKAALEMSAKEQVVLKLFAEQAFMPAFNLVMMRAIRNLVEAGYTPEAIFIELILSEEMIFTVDKMIEVGLVKQMNFHSQTSQYGSLSRGIKFSKVGDDLNQIQEAILENIENGTLAEAWEQNKNTAKLDVMKNFAYNSDFWEVEKSVYENLDFPIYISKGDIKMPTREQLRADNELSKLSNNYKNFFEGL